MKTITETFIRYLTGGDTSKIHSLFRSEDNFSGNKDLMLKDGNLLKKVTSRHKVPAKKLWQLNKGPYQENIIMIQILNREDSLLNLKKYEVLVYFLPDRFLKQDIRIDNYFIVRTPIKVEEKKLKLNPTFD